MGFCFGIFQKIELLDIWHTNVYHISISLFSRLCNVNTDFLHVETYIRNFCLLFHTSIHIYYYPTSHLYHIYSIWHGLISILVSHLCNTYVSHKLVCPAFPNVHKCFLSFRIPHPTLDYLNIVSKMASILCYFDTGLLPISTFCTP